MDKQQSTTENKKIFVIQQKLKPNQYMFVTSSANIFYLTKIQMDSVCLLLSKDKLIIFAPKLAVSQLKNIYGFQNVIPTENLKKEILKFLPQNVELLVDSQYIPFKTYNVLSKVVNDIKFTKLVTNLRMIKDEEEIKNITTASYITNKIINQAIQYLKPDVTEIDVKHLILKLMLEYNVEPSFDPIVAFDENTSYPHHVSATKKFTRNSLVLIDVGCKYKGYCCDITRMFNIENLKDKKIQNLYSKLKLLQKKLIMLCKPGVRVKYIDMYARKFFKKLGFVDNYLHSTGHGLGVEIHEPPRVSIKDATVLKPGMVITIEPGVYFEKKFGLRIEDDILITNEGYKVLS